MPILLRLPLALLGVLALLLMWTGTATADDTVPLPAVDCLVEPLAEGCDPAPTPVTEEKDEEPVETDEPSAPPAVSPVTGGTSALESATARIAANEAAAASPGTEGADVQSTETQEEAAAEPGASDSEQPDPAEVAACIGDGLTALLALLETEIGGAVDELIAEIEAGLTPALIADPAALGAFLAGLPARGEGIGEDITTGGEELQAALEAIAACLPEPPAGGTPPTITPPAQQPQRSHEVYYENCDDARAKGAAPISAGQPGYRPALDSDSDGIGCEQDHVTPVHQTYNTGTLAYTGFEPGPPLAAGAVLVVLGGGLLTATRRRA